MQGSRRHVGSYPQQQTSDVAHIMSILGQFET